MYIKASKKYRQSPDHPGERVQYDYYRLVKSYRSPGNKGPVKENVLNLGELPGEYQSKEMLKELGELLTMLIENDGCMERRSMYPELEKLAFCCYDERRVQHGLEELMLGEDDPRKREQMIRENEALGDKGHRPISEVMAEAFAEKKAKEDAAVAVKLGTLKFERARSFGAENICKTVVKELKLEEFLGSLPGWDIKSVRLALVQVIARAVHPASELGTAKWLLENSSLLEMFHLEAGDLTKDKLYDSALRLEEVRDGLDSHLTEISRNIFEEDQRERIYILDCTNIHFEGRYRKSKKLKHGRNKQKRNDCKQICICLVVNHHGMI